MGDAPPLPAGSVPSLADPKPLWRAHFRRWRQLQGPGSSARLEQQALARLPALLGPAGRLGIYWPLAGEPDLRALGALLPDRLALPAIRGEGGARALRYEAWTSGESLAPDSSGIPAPARPVPLGPEALVLLLVPALAFDRHGRRLGYGGGWYDRLRSDPAWRAVPALIVAPDDCGVERLPADPWDIPFDGWLTERGLEWLQAV